MKLSGLPASVDIRPLLSLGGMGAPRLAQWGPPVPAAEQGALSPGRAGGGESDVPPASANSSSSGQRAAEVNGQWWRTCGGEGA